MTDLSPFFTSLNAPVYGVRLPQEIAAALFSRYSRSAKGLREIFADEFLADDDIATLLSGQTTTADSQALQKARSFFDRVLVGYGDDSVAQLGGAHVACEHISNVAALCLTDARIGIAPLEKSTRYVRFDTKQADGTWPYYRFARPDLMTDYVATMDALFEAYAGLMEPMQTWVRHNVPLKDQIWTTPQGDTVTYRDALKTKALHAQAERAYESAIRAKTCDVLRGLLPASTLTNVGLYGSGQAFEYLLTKLLADDGLETEIIAERMQKALTELIPSFVKRAGRNVGYIEARDERMRQMLTSLKLTMFAKTEPGVRLFRQPAAQDHTKEHVVAAMLYPYATLPMSELRSLDFLQPAKLDDVIRAYVDQREHRRQKPGRALEHAEYTFEACANLGCYRDLHRHRLLTQQHQLLTTALGYDVPSEIEAAGHNATFTESLERAATYAAGLEKNWPYLAQYAVPFAFRVRWTMQLNLREAVHICELRSMPQGHEDYRVLVQSMAEQIIDMHPWTKPCFRFMDWNSYALGRLGAEVRTEAKRG